MTGILFDIATLAAALATMASVYITLRKKMIKAKTAAANNAAGKPRR